MSRVCAPASALRNKEIIVSEVIVLAALSLVGIAVSALSMALLAALGEKANGNHNVITHGYDCSCCGIPPPLWLALREKPAGTSRM